MTTYILPFFETQRGWYEIETNTIEEARELAKDMDYMAELEPNYKDGYTEWDENDIEPLEAVNYIRKES